MPIRNIVGIRKKTLDITNNFFKDIKKFKPGRDNYELQFFPRVEKFFLDIKKLGKKELSCYLRQQRYTCNIDPNDIEHKTRNIDFFYCLTALIICHYSEIDTLRYFFPKEFTKKEDKPIYSSNSWRIVHWLQILSYWFRQIFGREKYKKNTLIQDSFLIFEALRFVRQAMKSNYYLMLINAGPENLFSSHLYMLTAYILGVSTLDLKRIHNLNIPGDCSQTRWNIFYTAEGEMGVENQNVPVNH